MCMQTVELILLILVVLLAGALVYVMTRPKKDDSQSALLLKEDLRGLSEDITKLSEQQRTLQTE